MAAGREPEEHERRFGCERFPDLRESGAAFLDGHRLTNGLDGEAGFSERREHCHERPAPEVDIKHLPAQVPAVMEQLQTEVVSGLR